MKNRSNLTIILLLIMQCLMFSGHHAMLNLYEDEVCEKSVENTGDSVCKLAENCSTLEQDIRNQKFPPVCSFVGHTPVVCCSPKNITIKPSYNPPLSITVKPSVRSYTATEMCHQYSKLVYSTVKNPYYKLSEEMDEYVTIKDCYDVRPLIAGGMTAHPKEFPHMALIGYGNLNGENKTWGCGGSLISNRWVLSAAHCANNMRRIASWVRLGALNIHSDTAGRNDYIIVERVVHPHYKPEYIYNDIGLFRLEKDVKFSAYIRPICLNANQSLTFDRAKVAGWGRISAGGPTSHDLMRTYVQHESIKLCQQKYPPSSHRRINLGILEESMICAGDVYDGKDTCEGDSGGPLQINNSNYTSCVYTIIGITSFGKFCGSTNTPGVYTKVSNYITWIEQTVWPKS